MRTVFATGSGGRFLDQVRASGRVAAGDLLTGALYGVVSAADGGVSVEAADRALVAVSLLLVERAPEVVDDAPDPDGLRAYLEDLDTELTPARITAARAVLTRLLVADDNAWYRAHVEAGTLSAARADVRLLSDLLADAENR